MDLINEYRHAAYNENFNCEYMWLSLEKNRSEIMRYLEDIQKGDSIKYRFSMRDIDDVLTDKNFDTIDDGFISKLVIQKANFDVKQSTKENGCTTRLLFLVKDEKDSGTWFLYGYAKGRYNSWEKLNIKDGASLGYSMHISLSERDDHWSSGLSDTRAIQRLLERLKARRLG